VNRHLFALGVLNVAVGLFGLVAVGIIITVMTFGGLMSGDPMAMIVTSGVASFVTMLVLLFSVPSLVAGVGLLTAKPWAPTAAFIVGALNLMNVPFGTVVGIYTLWVMMRLPEGALMLTATADPQ
jgi:hypothetical protein